MKCPECGYDSKKVKVTLSIEKNMVEFAKLHRINMSQLLENAIRDFNVFTKATDRNSTREQKNEA